MLSKKSVFWETKEEKVHTWLFKKLSEATQWLLYKSPFGPLIQHIGSLGPRRSGIPLSSNLSALWNGNSWIVSPARTLQMEQVHIHISHLSPYRTPLIAQQVRY